MCPNAYFHVITCNQHEVKHQLINVGVTMESGRGDGMLFFSLFSILSTVTPDVQKPAVPQANLTID